MGRILITGGAGFIGTHLTRKLATMNIRPVIVDNLLGQIHTSTNFSDELRSMADCLVGDICDIGVWHELAAQFPDIETIVHLAALTGTGQSMFDIREYDRVNSGGTAAMIDALIDRRVPAHSFANLKHVVLASSRAIYGEGAYQCLACCGDLVYPPLRTAEQMAAHQWDFKCEECGDPLGAVRTPETAPPQPTSFYGATKLVQEHYLCTMLGIAGISHTVLRFQNVFGPGQSLKNPYTGVIGVFFSNIIGGRPLTIFEDGEVTRDFVYVSDVVDSIMLSISGRPAGAYNVGTGEFTRLADVGQWICDALGKQVPISCEGAYRVGDIRHNAADISKIAKLGYRPRAAVKDGLKKYVDWAVNETPMDAQTVAKASLDLRSSQAGG